MMLYLIRATAGAGKTTNLSKLASGEYVKLKSIENDGTVKEVGIQLDSPAICIAYTKVASGAIGSHCKRRKISEKWYPYVATTHSLALDIIQACGFSSKQIDSKGAKQNLIIKTLADNFKIDNEDFYMDRRSIADFCQKLRLMGIDPSVKPEKIEDILWQENDALYQRMMYYPKGFDCGLFFKNYLELNMSYCNDGVLDFTDMLYLFYLITTNKLNNSPSDFGHFKAMIIDEANIASTIFIKGAINLLRNKAINNLILLGDPSQAIFGVDRGVTENFTTLIKKEYPTYQEIKLIGSHRNQTMVHLVQSIFGNDKIAISEDESSYLAGHELEEVWSLDSYEVYNKTLDKYLPGKVLFKSDFDTIQGLIKVLGESDKVTQRTLVLCRTKNSAVRCLYAILNYQGACNNRPGALEDNVYIPQLGETTKSLLLLIWDCYSKGLDCSRFIRREKEIESEVTDEDAGKLDKAVFDGIIKIFSTYGVDWLKLKSHVKIDTIHSSLGEEAPRAVVFNCDENIRIERTAIDLEIAVRFVALTRSRNAGMLWISTTKGDIPKFIALKNPMIGLNRGAEEAMIEEYSKIDTDSLY